MKPLLSKSAEKLKKKKEQLNFWLLQDFLKTFFFLMSHAEQKHNAHK